MVRINDIELGEFPLFLSPMDDVTDYPFRQICKKKGADVLVTEFIASEALNRDAEKSLRKMIFSPEQHPIGIQIFGSDEDSLLRCLDIVAAAQPDFIDINWGCPVRKVAGKGAGSGMLRDIPKLLGITEALVKRSRLPITVKTRLGYEENDKPIVSLAERLQDIGVAAISLHGRTKTQMYSGKADWEMIARVKENPRLTIPLFGNGDITDPNQVPLYRSRYGVDGILIGRGAIGNPWIFEQSKRLLSGLPLRDIPVSERSQMCETHLLESIRFKTSCVERLHLPEEEASRQLALAEKAAIFEMRKHYGGYFWGLRDFRRFRTPLVTTPELDLVLDILHQISQYYG